MRIFGGHDYYDSALSMGIDPTIVMVRDKHKAAPVKDLGGSLLGPEMRLLPSNAQVERVSVVFCGKLYRGGIIPMAFGANQSFWSADKMREFAAKSKDGKVGIYNNWYTRRFEKTKWTLEEYFTPVDAPQIVREYMIRHKIAIMVERESKWKEDAAFEVNPTGLKQIGFAKAIDPYTAFQELSMWIGGILGGTSPEMVSITDDKVLIENHGYDKHSFRSSSRVA
jgi:hypothetical protein